MTDKEQRQRLIDSFVNAVYVYEDKIVFTFNYKGGAKTISLDDIQGSDLDAERPPQGIRWMCRQKACAFDVRHGLHRLFSNAFSNTFLKAVFRNKLTGLYFRFF